MTFFILFFLSFHVHAITICPGMIGVRDEKGVERVYCDSDHLSVTKSCFNKKDSCLLLKDLRSAKLKLKITPKQNPGSKICSDLGWKVMMGKIGRSDICLCDHPKGHSILCTSLIEAFRM